MAVLHVLQVAPPPAPKLSLSPYLSIVLGVTLSVVFCLAAGLCRRYSHLTTPQVTNMTNIKSHAGK